MISKLLTSVLFVVFSLSYSPVYSQCQISDAIELENYKRTTEQIQDGLTKFVQSSWHKSVSNFEFYMFLHYQKVDFIFYKVGINKGAITFKIANVGKVFNGVIFYSDGTFDNIVPFNVEWKKEDFTYPTIFSFGLKGDVIGTEDKITETNITNSPREPRWLENAIDLSKLPTKIVLLTDKGSKEYAVTTADYLNMQCILNRYKTPHEGDVR
jgi:hypothetical protein